MQPESLSNFMGKKIGGAISAKSEKRRGKRNPLQNKTLEKDIISESLVRLLWRATAPGLKPLRLPRAQMEVHVRLENAFPCGILRMIGWLLNPRQSINSIFPQILKYENWRVFRILSNELHTRL